MSSTLTPASWPSKAPPSVNVLFFGQVADRFGRSAQAPIPPAGCRLSELRRRLAERVEGGAATLEARGVRAAVDQEIAVGDTWVQPGQEVAFFSAFSGG